MRQCKKCKLVKYDWQMYKVVHALFIYWPTRNLIKTTFLCKKCAEEIGNSAILKELEDEINN